MSRYDDLEVMARHLLSAPPWIAERRPRTGSLASAVRLLTETLSSLVRTDRLEELGANILAIRFRLPLPIGAHESEGAQVSQLATGKSKLMVFYSI